MVHHTNNNGHFQVRHVAVLIETETSWGGRVIRGIAHFAEKHTNWHLLIDPRDHEKRSAVPDGWQGDGIIARITSRTQWEQIREKNLPVVNVDDVVQDVQGVGTVLTDESERARLAIEHLVARGFRKFGYFAPPSNRYSQNRGNAFIRAVSELGYECHEYLPGYRVGRKMSWEERQRRVSRWLASLPRPIAILAVDAHHARLFAETCHFAEVRIPDDVAILAGDTDDLLCEVSTPPLSSISVACERLGHEAAAMLHRMMNGEEPPEEPVLIAPHGVVSRQSTDVLAIDDPAVVRALRYIRTHAHHGIVVEDILREVPISRRSLEIQFRSYLGRSPAEEIRRVRLERGKQLLGKRELSVTEIALACGFSNATRFGVAFRKSFGTTPRAYRKTVIAD
ncbi:MAG TPA: DNA-binding transcriptional regulator [Lacipirellulaceae bacterium]|nr:DNA-binding transcriptional regulator [Lacipirellulaceae bacterium]